MTSRFRSTCHLQEVARGLGKVGECLVPTGVVAARVLERRRVNETPEQVDTPPLGQRCAPLERVRLPDSPSQCGPISLPATDAVAAYPEIQVQVRVADVEPVPIHHAGYAQLLVDEELSV